MSDKKSVFLDTNILVYEYENEHSGRNDICKKLVQECLRGERDFFVSNQVLAELASVLLIKIEKPLPIEDVRQIVEEINNIGSWKKINYRCTTVEKALSGKGPFWDLLITETMKENNVLEIYTENTRDFKRAEGIIAINPIDKNVGKPQDRKMQEV